MFSTFDLFLVCLQLAAVDVCGNDKACATRFKQCALDGDPINYCSIVIANRPTKLNCRDFIEEEGEE